MSAVPPAVRKVSERAFQSAVIDLARTLGYQVFHVHDSRRQVRRGVFVGDKDAAGIPDLILARERVIWAELKSARGRLSDAQRRWIDTLQAAGQEVYVWRPDAFASGEIGTVLARRIA
jgi:hypothetical protein